MKFRIVFSLLLCAVFGFAQPAQAGAWRLGGGGQSVGFGDDLDDVDRGFGVFSAALSNMAVSRSTCSSAARDMTKTGPTNSLSTPMR